MSKHLSQILNIDKDQVSKEVKSIGPFLAPFLKTFCVYFILTLDEPTLIHAFIKVLPVLCLIGLVVWIQRDGSSKYSRLVVSGLSLCAAGDVTLIWQDVHEMFFLAGMLLFALGHLAYMFAFGFRPFGLKEFVLSAAVTIIVYYFVLLPTLPSPLMTVALGIYAVLLGVMHWRAVARFNLRGEIPWRKVYAAVGAQLFIASDIILAVNKFVWKVPHEKEMIMVPYYLAQMGIALSVINSRLVVKCSND